MRAFKRILRWLVFVAIICYIVWAIADTVRNNSLPWYLDPFQLLLFLAGVGLLYAFLTWLTKDDPKPEQENVV